MSIRKIIKYSLLLFSFIPIVVQADSVITVGVAPHGGYVILGGSVIPLKEVTLSAQMPGRVVSIAGEEGDKFKAGTVLLRLNDEDLLAKKTAVEAQMASAKDAVQNAQVQYNRELWSPRVYNPRPMSGMAMPSMFDSFFNRNSFFGGNGNKSIERHADLVGQGSQVVAARSRVREVESKLREIDAKLRDTVAIAPFDGVIMKKQVEIGDTVQPGQPLLVFSYIKFLRIRADVPARLMPGLRKGMVVPAMLDVGNTQVNVRVAQISPVADKTRHTVTVKFDLPEGVPSGVGTYAEVMIPDVNSPMRALPVVPNAAIQRNGSLPSVMVLNHNNKPEMRLIRIGEKVGEDSVTVLSGLKPGERILVHGHNRQ